MTVVPAVSPALVGRTTIRVSGYGSGFVYVLEEQVAVVCTFVVRT